MERRNVPIKKFDDEKRIAFGEVYVPDVIDTHGDFMSKATIEQMAYAFLGSGKVNRIDKNHDLVETGSSVVESFIARAGDSEFIPGSWVLAVHIPDDDLWGAVKSGELNGFSMYGIVNKRVERIVEIDIPDDGKLIGKTAEYEGHIHKYTVQFGDDGAVTGGSTDWVDGHCHEIRCESVTEAGNGHTHRYNILDAVGER